MKKFLRVHEVAEQLKVSSGAVRYYANQGKIPFDLTPKGHRVFQQSDVDVFMGKGEDVVRVYYVRSSQGKVEQLEAQEALLTKAYGSALKVFKDKGSGLNENRAGLKKLLTEAKKGTFNTLCVTQQDRLTRFGYTYLEELFGTYGVKIVVFGDGKERTLHEELLQDFMSLVASFSGKFYRLRGYEQQRKLLAEAGAKLE